MNPTSFKKIKVSCFQQELISILTGKTSLYSHILGPSASPTGCHFALDGQIVLSRGDAALLVFSGSDIEPVQRSNSLKNWTCFIKRLVTNYLFSPQGEIEHCLILEGLQVKSLNLDCLDFDAN